MASLKWESFHKNRNCIGVELELTLVDKDLKKPVQQEFSKAMLNTLAYQKKEREEAIKKCTDQQKARCIANQIDDIESIYVRMVSDPSYCIPISFWELLKKKKNIPKFSLKYCIPDQHQYMRDSYQQYIISDNEDRGAQELILLSQEHTSPDVLKEDIKNTENFFKKRIGKEYVFTRELAQIAVLKKQETKAHLIVHVANAYANKILPHYVQLQKELPRELKPKLKYDRCDALEIITSPQPTVQDIKEDLLRTITEIRPFLNEKALYFLFAAVLPTGKPTHWPEILNKGQAQNIFGLHVHFGRIKNAIEAAVVYEAYRRTAPELLALTANSGVFNKRITKNMCERQYLYQNKIPPALPVKTHMIEKEKQELTRQIRLMFRPNTNPLSNQTDLRPLIPLLLNKKVVRYPVDNPSRATSCVWIRPELGTVEVRITDIQTNYEQPTLSGHIQQNLVVIDLIDGIGKAALHAYHQGKEQFKEKRDLERVYETAIKEGLNNFRLRKYAADLLKKTYRHLNKNTKQVLIKQITQGKSPAQIQKEIFRHGGISALAKAIIAK